MSRGDLLTHSEWANIDSTPTASAISERAQPALDPQGRIHRAGSTGPDPQGRIHRAGAGFSEEGGVGHVIGAWPIREGRDKRVVVSVKAGSSPDQSSICNNRNLPADDRLRQSPGRLSGLFSPASAPPLLVDIACERHGRLADLFIHDSSTGRSYHWTAIEPPGLLYILPPFSSFIPSLFPLSTVLHLGSLSPRPERLYPSIIPGSPHLHFDPAPPLHPSQLLSTVFICMESVSFHQG
ncbi:unnamed protein product [Pleuronectes platessa]|uniref:Uncharacterized protein n=1 Tax=Pleuronectes platessa TaxID=8262 RepID=A0A9N7UAU3_PLEPL|nr:unnamed protein product [Pleuronectes platessa]